MEKRYKKVSQQLVDLGYNYTVKPDSVFLVEKLVNDLIETTENLEKYMNIAQQAVKECENLKFGAEPYKCDNAKLVKECNDLHKTLIETQESNAKEVRNYKKQISSLEKEKQEYVESQKQLREKVRQLELTTARKSYRSSNSNLDKCNLGKTKTTKSAESLSTMALSEQKVNNLTKQVSKLKEQQLELCACNEELKTKLANREKEIHRLSSLLEFGRPIELINNECCYQDAKLKFMNKQDEVNQLQKCKNDLEIKLKEARCKQHEAMKHALNLAERNAQLEKELKDIDQMALSVEHECNNTVKSNGERVKKLQERLQISLFELQDLEKQVSSMKHERERLISDLEASKIEKRHLQSVLEESIEDKKRLAEKMNKSIRIEEDLNNEVDKLVQENAEQKRTIAELNGQLLALTHRSNLIVYDDLPERGPSEKRPEKRDKSRKKSPPKSPNKYGKNTRRRSPINNAKKTKERSRSPPIEQYYRNEKYFQQQQQVPLKTPTSMGDEPDNDYDKENKGQNGCQCKDQIERVKSERDFYVREYKQLVEKMRPNVSNRYEFTSTSENYNIVNEPIHTAGDLKEQITRLQYENQNLAKEKHNLLLRLENVRDYSDPTEYLTIKSTMKRIERERDLLKADIDRLGEERDSLKHRLKLSDEMHGAELERYKKLVNENEEQIRKMEKERYDILQNTGSRRATITNLEDQCDTLKEQLKSTQTELIHHKTIYTQLKVLHEQTDRALADSQNQLVQLENQIANNEYKRNMLDNNRAELSADVERLRNDIDVLRKNLVCVEQEKDSLLMQLDEKTENLASAEEEIKDLKANVFQKERANKELRSKIGSTLDDKNTKELQLKSSESDIHSLRMDLEAALKSKDLAFIENKRLQDELCACTMDVRRHENDLQMAHRQIEDLKRQSQHYVAEVKRIEDLMTQKEVERSEMLDQFRTLSHEASTLENNNHTLETVAHQSKLQLSVALDHAGELEKLVEHQKSVVASYESQIAELTSQIATLEMKLKHSLMQQERQECEMSSLQDLCAKLDKQKDQLKNQLSDKEARQSHIEHQLSRVQRQSEVASMSLEKEQSTTKSIETILSETRRQLVDQQLLNEELRGEVLRLKGQVSEMEQNLVVTTDRLDNYQEKALEYSKENKRLRREITDDRYYQSKKYPSL